MEGQRDEPRPERLSAIAFRALADRTTDGELDVLRASASSLTPKDWQVLLKTLLLRGRFDQVRAVLGEVRARPLNGDQRWIERHEGTVERYPASAPLGAVPFDLADNDRDVVVFTQPGADATLLVFCYSRLHAAALHPVLVTRGVHLVYLYDERGFGCVGGIESLGATYGESLEGLRAIVAALSAERLYTLGASKSGYAAIHYGLDLGAAGILAFSPSINITDEFMRGKERQPEKLAQLRAMDPAAAIDLRPLIERAGGRALIHIWYGTEVALNTLHAEHVAGAPGVVLREVHDTRDRNTMLSVLWDGRIRDALDALLGPARDEALETAAARYYFPAPAVRNIEIAAPPHPAVEPAEAATKSERIAYYRVKTFEREVRISPVYTTESGKLEPDWDTVVATFPKTLKGFKLAQARTQELNLSLRGEG